MLNQVTVVGRLARDPDFRYTPSGTPTCRLVVAVERGYTNQDGERETDFLDVRVWRKLAETCGQHLTKGRMVAVSGEIHTRSYKTESGENRKAWEIAARTVRFLDSKNGKNGHDEGAPDEAPVEEEPIPF